MVGVDARVEAAGGSACSTPCWPRVPTTLAFVVLRPPIGETSPVPGSSSWSACRSRSATTGNQLGVPLSRWVPHAEHRHPRDGDADFVTASGRHGNSQRAGSWPASVRPARAERLRCPLRPRGGADDVASAGLPPRSPESLQCGCCHIPSRCRIPRSPRRRACTGGGVAPGYLFSGDIVTTSSRPRSTKQ